MKGKGRFGRGSTPAMAVFFFCTAAAMVFADQPVRTIFVVVSPGPEYSHVAWMGIVPIRVTPQIAVWLEDESGNFLGAIYVTRAAGKGEWRGGKGVTRPEALPVFSFRRGSLSAEAVSGATPGGSVEFFLERAFSLVPRMRYRVFAEANASFDYNERYPKGKTGVNGQPSLLYSGSFLHTGEPVSVTLEPMGVGDVTGASGRVDSDMSGLDTALEMIGQIRVEIR